MKTRQYIGMACTSKLFLGWTALETSRNTQQKHPGDLGKLANYFDDTNKVNGLDLGVSRLYCYMFVEGKLLDRPG